MSHPHDDIIPEKVKQQHSMARCPFCEAAFCSDCNGIAATPRVGRYARRGAMVGRIVEAAVFAFAIASAIQWCAG